MSRVCILDYGSGNVRSVANLFATLGETRVSNDPHVIADATHLVLPGVGAYGAAMARIAQQLPLDGVRRAVFEQGKPFLGICVGMQVLSDEGHEFGQHAGLGWIPGRVRALDSAGLPLPHVGWNDIRGERPHPLLLGLEATPDFYFVHSYAFATASADDVIATVEYGSRFPAVVGRENVLGVQFHPEKSQRAGAQLLKNFLELA
ncbi:imidazole glycerol phosphate synthase subunit HisH [Metapseudomonas otitidis]|uniref:imidazole glycerol phosphate synthase subunit HisH n=1 Tax=Metapseudomonas otitidis TaxID=319939 RepID=UPI0024AE62DD|nr:imidazole glycerol phosphate synthase subunit HisH [Pseudomonas otitidis]MDI6524688.1 imidazole glycerol phosphate synthase subunit HisH [Pseudomonas otitidis]